MLFPVQSHQLAFWRPREVPGCLASSTKLFSCLFSDTAQATFATRSRRGYRTPHQSNIFCSFCFRCYHMWEDCSMTISRPALLQQYSAQPLQDITVKPITGLLNTWFFEWFSAALNTVYWFTHPWGLKARGHLRLIFYLQVSPSHHLVHPTLILGAELSGSPLSSFCHTFSSKFSSISKLLIPGHTFSWLRAHYSLSIRQT